MRWWFGLFVLALAVLARPGPAEAACVGVAQGEALPEACCGGMPSDGRDPYIPAALMQRDAAGNLINLRTCFMTSAFPPAGAVLTLQGQFGYFAPDAATGAGRLVAEGGQGPTSAIALPGPAARGILSIPIESASDILPEGALALVRADVLVVVFYDGPTGTDWSRRTQRAVAAMVPSVPF